jgi:hypothetical protein
LFRHGHNPGPVQVVEELNLSAPRRKMVLGGTAARILKL